MIRLPASVTHGTFRPRPDITLVFHPSFISVKRLYDTATRDNGLFCGADPQRHEIHLWCVLERVSVDEVVAEIGEALAMLLFPDDACVIEAPGFFVMNDADGHAYVALQPKNAKDTAECLSALEACPVEAIGSDGDS